MRKHERLETEKRKQVTLKGGTPKIDLIKNKPHERETTNNGPATQCRRLRDKLAPQGKVYRLRHGKTEIIGTPPMIEAYREQYQITEQPSRL